MRAYSAKSVFLFALWAVCQPDACIANSKAIVGLLPKAAKALKVDGKLDDWEGAFVTPVHVGHPDFATTRGGHILFLWDEEHLYIGLRCIDRTPNHSQIQIANGDAVELFLDTRRGDEFGTADYTPGTLHMFWTPFTGSDIKPRLQVRNLPALKDIKLDGAVVAAEKNAKGYNAEFKLPWANIPPFAAEAGAVISIDCALCSSDGAGRVDRTFVYSSPAAATTPSVFGQVLLVDKIEPADIEPLGRALLPLSLTKSANYDWLYGAVGVSPTIDKNVVRLEGKIVDESGKVWKTSVARKQAIEGTDFNLWWHRWELHDVPKGTYLLELAALDKDGKVITQRKEKLLHADSSPAKRRERVAPPKKSDEPPPAIDEERLSPKKSDKPAPTKAQEDEKPPPAKKEEESESKENKDEKPSSAKKDDEPSPSKGNDKPEPVKKAEKLPPPKEGGEPDS
jgi:hypothetical protein